MQTLYYVTGRSATTTLRFTQKRRAIRAAHRIARRLLKQGATKRNRTISVRMAPAGHVGRNPLLYQCHALKVGNSVRIVREEL